MAVRMEYSVVNTVSLGTSAKLPRKAKFTAPSGTTSGLSPAVRGMKYALANGIITGIVLALLEASSSI